MERNIDIRYHFTGLQEHVEESVKEYVQDNVEKKMDTYFKKILTHPDARVDIRVNIEKHKGDDERYDGTFLFTGNGKVYAPYQREGDRGFENVRDLVNHAFDHLKLQLADKR